jgi:hypothetical protein
MEVGQGPNCGCGAKGGGDKVLIQNSRDLKSVIGKQTLCVVHGTPCKHFGCRSGKLLLVFTSAVIFISGPRCTHNHIFLSHAVYNPVDTYHMYNKQRVEELYTPSSFIIRYNKF